jgi:DNA-directed RNA polymerase subunit RPC12/RpoP
MERDENGNVICPNCGSWVKEVTRLSNGNYRCIRCSRED